MAVTEADIIRILSDARFERTVLAIVRRKLSNHAEPEEHVSESDRELDPEWGWIPIAQAAVKYGLSPGDIAEAIQKRHVKGNSTKVDEDHLRRWAFDGKQRGLPKAATEMPEDLEAPAPSAPASVVESYSLAEAAELLQLTEERITEHLLSGTLRQVGEDRVSKASVQKHRDHLMRFGALKVDVTLEKTEQRILEGGGAKAGPIEGNPIISTRDAAALLNISPAYVSVLASTGKLVKAGYGHVTRASVLEHQARQRKAVAAPVPAVPEAPAPQRLHPPEAPAVNDEPWMTTADAAAFLGLKMPYTSLLTSKGILQRVAWGKVNRASVEAYAAKQKQPA